MNKYPHIIRLRGPWEFEPLSGEHAPPPGRIVIPCAWTESVLGSFRGTVRFRRRFHWPATLTEQERLLLHFTEIDGRATFKFNGQELDVREGDPLSWDITKLVQPRNDLIAELEYQGAATATGGGIVRDVELHVVLHQVP